MVQINVSQQLKASIGSTRNYEMSGIVDIDGSNKTVQGVVRLMRTDHGILVKGTDMVSGAPLPLPEEPDCFTIDEHNILDLTEAIRQYALLTVPMKPLCHQDCAGLCPTCGINLNQASCDCPPEPADPRWSELSKLVLTDTKVSVKEQEGTN